MAALINVINEYPFDVPTYLIDWVTAVVVQ